MQRAEADRAALGGIRVVDLSSYIAGAYCASLLADMGADVVKVESFDGDGLRGLLGGFHGWNRGKRGICLNLDSEEGREVLACMVRRCDVVVENFRPGVTERLGVAYDDLRALKPDVIYCSITAYGETGPYVDKPGFDPLVQAMSGAMAAEAGPDGAPVFLKVAVSDYAAAILGAWGVAMALYHRAHTGLGQRVQTSLFHAAAAVQSGELLEYEGRPPERRLGTVGRSLTYRLYQAADGWLFIGAGDEQWAEFCRAIGRDDLAADRRFADAAARDADSGLRASLEHTFETLPRDALLAHLRGEGIAAVPARLSYELPDDEQLRANGLVAEHVSSTLGPIWQMGLAAKLAATPGRLQRAAPALGEHTDDVLTELSYAPEEIAGLRQRRVVQ